MRSAQIFHPSPSAIELPSIRCSMKLWKFDIKIYDYNLSVNYKFEFISIFVLLCIVNVLDFRQGGLCGKLFLIMDSKLARLLFSKIFSTNLTTLPVFLFCIMLSIVVTDALTAAKSKVVLVADGKTSYVIVVPDDATETEKYAASELQVSLEVMSGVRFEVAAEKDAAGRSAVLIGNTRRGAEIIPDNELKPLGDEGFIIRTHGSDLVIRGGGRHGTLYGAYALLEDHLGVRWYAPDATVIPARKTIEFTDLNDSQKPALEYRESFFFHAFDGDWAARNRVNGNHHRLTDRHGGKITYVGGFVHTFNSLVPPDKYFKEHPEYFSGIDGVRVPNAQLCLTNPDVLEIVTARVLELAESTKGEAAIISVSQNDNMRPCTCKRCRAVDKEEGSPAGLLIRFVNQVADAVAEKYPNVAIDTLAYQYTENAPRLVKPRPNVIVRLCHMAPSCDLHPLNKCYWNSNYVKNLKTWAKISNRVYIWHYVTNFSNYLMPFPNLNAVTKDMAFYSHHNVKGLFAQGSYQSHGGDMAELKAWLIAKLLWNPDADAESLIDDFVRGYYGPAAPAMADYIAVQREQVRSPKLHAHLFSPPTAGYLNAELLAKMADALDRAEKLAASDPAAAERVRRARLAYSYTQLAAPELFAPSGAQKAYGEKKLHSLFNTFKSELEHFGITHLKEAETTDKTLQRLRWRILGWKE
ncbi:MAG: DUF4838 domain-containing protein [bacterium]